MNRLRVVSVTLGITAATLLPASSAFAAHYSGRPPSANFPNAEDQTPVSDVWVEHCQSHNDGAGVRVYTPGTPGRSGDVKENCQG